ncbi:MAG: winged helix-turn-helix domain-containing protein [Nitrososphaerales archaeon]
MVEGGLQRKERRHKLQIYYDILVAIQQETTAEGGARPTRIQHLSNMSYDKLVRYLDELVEKEMISRGETLVLTDKAREFLRDYEKVKDLIERMGLE